MNIRINNLTLEDLDEILISNGEVIKENVEIVLGEKEDE